jgi:hypothetical protein
LLLYIYVFSVPLYMVIENKDDWLIDLEGDLEFLKYAINIEKASMIYLSPVQKEHVKRKLLYLEAYWVVNIKISIILKYMYNLKC